MLWGIHTIVKHQFTVIAGSIIQKEVFIANRAAVTHLNDKVITLPLKLRHHFTCAVNTDNAGFTEGNRLC